ncbi:hypothetical protein [Streptomyces soliscabiei]|uniref:hypothetical protein n=1 Tax=Streptomyces soliscabiei TaxID=588897 RepID=UPI0029A9580E|nr:hypothetical protein [Streptomyces sp. NY05-11A]MDX2681069.1 hypothetical protein [Streptomyces sp. NY05-11A]
MTTASQTSGALPPETPRGGPRTTMPISPDVPADLLVLGPEPLMPECRTCGTMPGMLQACPEGRRYQSGAQVLYCTQHLPTPTPVQAAEGVIAAAMEHGKVTPRELAQAEHDAGLLFDAQAAEDIAAAAAEQAHADDAAEIAERGRQLARVAGTVRQRDAVLRLCEGRPGTDLLTVAEVAAAAEYGTTALDQFPMTLTWSGEVDIPGPGDARKAVVRCTSPYGGRADLVVQDADRAKLASLVGTEVRDVHAACPTRGCGGDHDFDPADMYGWARLEIPGTEDDRPRWYCSAACVFDAVARAGDELAAVDQAAAVDPDEQGHELPYGDDAHWATRTRLAETNAVDSGQQGYLTVADDLDERYGVGASDEYALQVAEAAAAGFEDERGDTGEGAR